MNQIQAAKDQLSQLVFSAYRAAVSCGDLPEGMEDAGRVEIPKDPKNGDYASGFAMQAARTCLLYTSDAADEL